MKTGLVLEGGAMRGMFTCGVTDVWMEAGVSFDGIIGVSAGAAFGCNIKSGQPGRAIRYNKRFCRDPRFVSWRSFFRTGDLYNARFAYYTIPDELDPFDRAAFAENPTSFTVVATDVETGRPVYHDLHDGLPEDIEWIRASASLPLVSRIVELDGKKLLDGGIADAVPFARFLEQGYDRVVVIVTQPAGYVKKKDPKLPLARLMLRRYPNMIEAMATRHVRYNEMLRALAEAEAAGRVLVVRPPAPLHISGIVRDPERLEAVYRIGRRTGESELARIRAYLG